LSYVGTPYHHQGRIPGVAMDCPAPVIVACWELGLKPRSFDVMGYGREPDGATLKGYCDEHMDPISLDEAQPGDVLLTAWTFDRMRPRHLGVLVDSRPDRRYWVQAEGYRHKQVRKTRLMFGVDRMRLVQAYRVPGCN
jgi:cell wall-associated NlpC family hydrolase